HDVGGLALGLPLPALIFREQCLRLLLEAARLVELALDAVGAIVDCLHDNGMDAGIDHHGDENRECDCHPEFGIFQELQHRGPQRWSPGAPAACTAAEAGADPISRSMMAVAASAAMPCTLAIAADLRAPMPFSASPIRALSSVSSALRAVSALAASCS